MESKSYQVEVANNGQRALEKISSNPPHLVLLDIMMPEMNWFEVTRHIRQDTSLPFIPNFAFHSAIFLWRSHH